MSAVCLVCRSDDPTVAAKKAPFRCPKCECPYCSLACYKAHGEQCTQMFQEETIVQHLSSFSVGEEQKEAIMSILRKDAEQRELEEEEEIEERREERLEEMLEILNRAEEETSPKEDAEDVALRLTLSVWNSLTPEEQREFETMISRGTFAMGKGKDKKTIAHDILDQQMNPWWRSSPSLVIDLDSPPESLISPSSPSLSSFPLPSSIPDDLPHVQSLLGGKSPSPSLQIHLIDLLFSYVCAFRVFGGELFDPLLRTEIKQLLTSISSALNVRDRSSAHNPQLMPSDLKTMIETLIHRCRFTLRLPASDPFATELLQDVIDLLKHRKHVSLSLYHLHRLFEATETATKDKKNKRMDQMISKKLFFFVCWTNSPPPSSPPPSDSNHDPDSAFVSEEMLSLLSSQISSFLSVCRSKVDKSVPSSSGSSSLDWRSIVGSHAKVSASPFSFSSSDTKTESKAKTKAKVLIEEIS